MKQYQNQYVTPTAELVLMGEKDVIATSDVVAHTFWGGSDDAWVISYR